MARNIVRAGIGSGQPDYPIWLDLPLLDLITRRLGQGTANTATRTSAPA